MLNLLYNNLLSAMRDQHCEHNLVSSDSHSDSSRANGHVPESIIEQQQARGLVVSTVVVENRPPPAIIVGDVPDVVMFGNDLIQTHTIHKTPSIAANSTLKSRGGGGGSRSNIVSATVKEMEVASRTLPDAPIKRPQRTTKSSNGTSNLLLKIVHCNGYIYIYQKLLVLMIVGAGGDDRLQLSAFDSVDRFVREKLWHFGTTASAQKLFLLVGEQIIN